MAITFSIVLTIMIWIIIIEFLTYFLDRKDFNKGVCPKCGKPFKKLRNDKVFTTYGCYDCIKIASVSNIYLNFKYGRNLKEK